MNLYRNQVIYLYRHIVYNIVYNMSVVVYLYLNCVMVFYNNKRYQSYIK